MRNALTFMKLDIYTIKPYLTLKTLSVALIICALMALNSNTTMFLGTSLVFMSVYFSYPFAIAEKHSLDLLYCSLPIIRKDVVKGRFLFLILANGVVGAVTFTLAFVLTFIRQSLSMQELFVMFMVFFIVINLVECAQFCIYFKLEFAKSRMIAYIPLIVLSSIMLLFAQLAVGDNSVLGYSEAFNAVGAYWPVILLIGILLIAALYYLAILISVKFYERKEF